MLGSIVRKIFGSRNQRIIKKHMATVALINQMEQKYATLDISEFPKLTTTLKQRFANGETLDDLLPEAFAMVREVSKRTMNMRHFDVQLVGGIVLHSGKISEMRTGEGKTLVATLPAYLNAITGKGVHVITVNDYLAKRDAEWMSPIYEALGLTVGVILPNTSLQEKRAAYNSDITYGTNNEFGFDYLRDNMAFNINDKMQRDLNFAIIDEVDSILIDEARTPLIISGAEQDSSDLYRKINVVAPNLTLQAEKDGPGDFAIDEKSKQVHLTEEGHQNVEELLVREGLLDKDSSLYDATNIQLMQHLSAALRAHFAFEKDVDYIVQGSEVVIVDENTGRTMQGRRWSDGLHQAVEAKEGVKIQSENQTLASITFQNYFRLYNKLSGMTGTADTEAYELQQIYGLEVVVIPTNKPSLRRDLADVIYFTVEEKFAAIVEDIEGCIARKQPVLVGTISIESSEYLSQLLKSKKIPHNVLNAKYHIQEAKIIAEAGRPGAVTIATNMAGRGTDIILGGNLQLELSTADKSCHDKITEEWKLRHRQVLDAGGLHIIGTERHDSRRVDNQLRGRSGRQGDPGSTCFYLSTRDKLLRIFFSDNMSNMLNKMSEPGKPISASLVTKSIENAQRKLEGYNFDVRKQLLEYDNVANDQRLVIYQQRNEIMSSEQISNNIISMRKDVISTIIHSYMPEESLDDQWDLAAIEEIMKSEFNCDLEIKEFLDEDESRAQNDLIEKIISILVEKHVEKTEILGVENMQRLEKIMMLNVLDTHWKDHLATLDYIRQSIHLRGYAQKDPKQEYKREAFELFGMMLDAIRREVIGMLAICEVKPETDMNEVDNSMRHEATNVTYTHDNAEQSTSDDNDNAATPTRRLERKVGRNEPCPCGSGKKYKQCHGNLTEA